MWCKPCIPDDAMEGLITIEQAAHLGNGSLHHHNGDAAVYKSLHQNGVLLPSPPDTSSSSPTGHHHSLNLVTISEPLLDLRSLGPTSCGLSNSLSCQQPNH